MAIRRILVLGSDGQLGKELYHIHSDKSEYEFSFVNRRQLDIVSEDVGEKIHKYNPEIIINCAAYTAVDKAESDWLICRKINQTGVSNIAKTAKNLGAILIHISSDYVYHINNGKPLREDEPCHPQSIYAISKANGENLARHFNDKTIILRTSWIYSQFGGNFVKTMIKLSETKKELTIVDDQIGCPTYAKDLANAILQIIDYISQNPSAKEIYGVYNFTNEGLTNWKEFAQEIFELSGIRMEIDATSTKSYGAPAPRPLWSVMSLSKIKSTFKIRIRHWREALKDMLNSGQQN